MPSPIFPSDKVFILDGAIGTELLRRGAPFNTCLEQWALEHVDILQAIHTEYKQAGADILYTATFGSNRFRLHHFNLSDKAEAFTHSLAEITRTIAGSDILVAGCIGPAGDDTVPDDILREGFKEHISSLLMAEVDLLVIETMTTIKEATLVLQLARSMTDKPIIISMVFTRHGLTMDNFSPEQIARKLIALGASGIGYNCLPCSEQMLSNIRQLAQATPPDFPIIAKPNAGQPTQQNGKLLYGCSPDRFARFGEKLVASGASLIGGCCGTTPEYIAKLHATLYSKPGNF